MRIVILPAPCEASGSERSTGCVPRMILRGEQKVRLVHPGGTREGSVAGDLSRRGGF